MIHQPRSLAQHHTEAQQACFQNESISEVLTMVTRFPNHWWASSWPTTSATHCLTRADVFLGSTSRAVSLYVTRPQFSMAPGQIATVNIYQHLTLESVLGMVGLGSSGLLPIGTALWKLPLFHLHSCNEAPVPSWIRMNTHFDTLTVHRKDEWTMTFEMSGGVKRTGTDPWLDQVLPLGPFTLGLVQTCAQLGSGWVWVGAFTSDIRTRLESQVWHHYHF